MCMATTKLSERQKILCHNNDVQSVPERNSAIITTHIGSTSKNVKRLFVQEHEVCNKNYSLNKCNNVST